MPKVAKFTRWGITHSDESPFMVDIVASHVFAMTFYPQSSYGPRTEIMSPQGFSISVRETPEQITAALGLDRQHLRYEPDPNRRVPQRAVPS
jgi:hypothetical protein